MALSADDIKKIVTAIFEADVIRAVAPPDENADWHDGNEKWSFGYAVHSPNVVGRETRRLVRELDAKAATLSSQVAAVAADVQAIQTGGVDLDALAAKVADVLAERLLG